MHRIVALIAITGLALPGCMQEAELELGAERQAAASTQGHSVQGHSVQGHSVQGHSIAAITIGDFSSGTIVTLELTGTALTGETSGGGVVGPANMPGVSFPVTLTSNDEATLVLTAYKLDNSTTTMFETQNQSNSDIHLYQTELIISGEETAFNVCGDGEWGFFMKGHWNDSGTWNDEGASFVCNSGVAAKCARVWGYKPWKEMTSNNVQYSKAAMRDFHNACIRAARADYCATGVSYTVNGTLIDITDSAHFNRHHAESEPHGMFAYESTFIHNGPTEIGRLRHQQLDPTAANCFSQDQINATDFSWTELFGLPDWNNSLNPQLDSDSRKILVSTVTHCTHTPGDAGGPLARDCNDCTRSVCSEEQYTHCCDNQWVTSCAERAYEVCGVQAVADPYPASMW